MSTHTLLSASVRALAMRKKAVMLLPADAADLEKCRCLLAEKLIDGFTFLTSGDKVLLNGLYALNVPFVAWDDDQAREPHCAVTGAAGRAGRLAGRNLADLGCASVLFVHSTQDELAVPRLKGLTPGLMRSRGSKGEIQSLEIEDSSPHGGGSPRSARGKTHGAAGRNIPALTALPVYLRRCAVN